MFLWRKLNKKMNKNFALIALLRYTSHDKFLKSGSQFQYLKMSSEFQLLLGKVLLNIQFTNE